MVSPYPNMSVPGASNLSPAGSALFGDQVQGETEEERRKRLQQLQAAQNSLNNSVASVGNGYGSALSPAGNALFGS